MIIKILRVALYGQAIGRLFSYGDICRFVADADLAAEAPDGLPRPVLSLSMLAADPLAQAALWANVQSPLFNAQGGKLPNFFQNLLPEGVLRQHIAGLRGCAENDHFELLAACGADLPGAVTVHYEETSARQLQRLVTQDNDALEMSVVDMPLDNAISISGMQPKLALVSQGRRYVHRTRGRDGVRIIAKLPVVGQPHMPLLESTALALARAAGVQACKAELAPIEAIDSLQGYTLPRESDFLAVTRFDRKGAEHLHFEDFAQILGVDPGQKYTLSYLDMARLMMGQPGMGEAAVHELLRRLVVNELLGNPDAHLKNFGVLYEKTSGAWQATLAPAFDIVPYAVSQGIDGHALPLVRKEGAKTNRAKPMLFTPAAVREFCALAGVQEHLARQAIRKTCALALQAWPTLINRSALPLEWRDKLLMRLAGHPLSAASKRGVNAATVLPEDELVSQNGIQSTLP